MIEVLRLTLQTFDEALEILESNDYEKINSNSFSDPAIVSLFQQTTRRPVHALCFWNFDRVFELHWVRRRTFCFLSGLETISGDKLDYDDPIFLQIDEKPRIPPKETIKKLLSNLKVDFVIFRAGELENPNFLLRALDKHIVLRSLPTYGFVTSEFFPNKKTFADTKRQKKRLQLLGELEAGFVWLGDVKFDKYFNDLLQSKVERFQKTKVRNTLALKSDKMFYKSLAGLSSNNVEGRLFVLRLNNEFVAGAVCLFNGREFIYLLPSFKSELSQFSPGNVCLMELINSVRQENSVYFDFSVGGEAYKARWSNPSKTVHTIYLASSNLAWLLGHVFKATLILRKYLSSKRILRSLYFGLKARSSQK